uniref:Methionine--tRNA ligase, mitochondrial n=1 Tax=Onchocerca volvulus TaxID=6282 RepID=A0A8R1XNH4_ONCVO
MLLITELLSGQLLHDFANSMNGIMFGLEEFEEYNKNNDIACKEALSLLKESSDDLINKHKVMKQAYSSSAVGTTTINRNLLKDAEGLPNCKAILNQVVNHLSKYEFNHIILLITNISSEANAYIDRSTPWTLSKTNRERMNLIIHKLLEYIRIIGILLQPIVPKSAEIILDQLQIPKKQRNLKSLCGACITSGVTLPKPTPVFLKINNQAEGT